jgi:hypothetical protein
MLANLNVAVRQLSPESKYCKMVLGDDWIFPECLEKMVAVAEEYPSVGLVSACERFGEKIRLTGLSEDTSVVAGREARRQFLMDKLLLFGAQTSVLYRADLVRSRNPFYVETDMYADFESCFALLSKSDLGFVHQILTFSRPRAGSVGAISADIGAHYRSLLGLLFTYGPACLADAEFEYALDRQLSQYYRFLGRRLFVERDPKFWAYHKATFERAGIRFSRTRLTRAAARQLLNTVLHPKSSLQSVRRFFSLRKFRNLQTRKVVSEFGSDRAPRSGSVEKGDQTIGGDHRSESQRP